MTTVLKDIYIEAGEIDRYFDDKVPADIWRAKKKRDKSGIFDLIEEPYVQSNGLTRFADITIDELQGVRWVFVKEKPRGASTFDRPNTFGSRSWEYYKIPKGLELPHGLAITKDRFNKRLNATHYTIAPAWDMPLQKFKELLQMLAKSLVKEEA